MGGVNEAAGWLGKPIITMFGGNIGNRGVKKTYVPRAIVLDTIKEDFSLNARDSCSTAIPVHP